MSMAVQTFIGTVENGRIQLQDPVTLPEHATVFVVVPDSESAPQARIFSPRLKHPEQAADFAKTIVEEADADL